MFVFKRILKTPKNWTATRGLYKKLK